MAEHQTSGRPNLDEPSELDPTPTNSDLIELPLGFGDVEFVFFERFSNDFDHKTWKTALP